MTKDLDVPVKDLPKAWQAGFDQDAVVHVTLTVADAVTPDPEVQQQIQKGDISPVFEDADDALAWLRA